MTQRDAIKKFKARCAKFAAGHFIQGGPNTWMSMMESSVFTEMTTREKDALIEKSMEITNEDGSLLVKWEGKHALAWCKDGNTWEEWEYKGEIK